jgi:hypothetical protein
VVNRDLLEVSKCNIWKNWWCAVFKYLDFLFAIICERNLTSSALRGLMESLEQLHRCTKQSGKEII